MNFCHERSGPLALAISLTIVLVMTFEGAYQARAAADSFVPTWGSLRAGEVNMRVGPGEDYRIAWVYHRRHYPVKVLRQVEGWHLIEDQDGARGWIAPHFLNHDRWGVVTSHAPVAMHDLPDDSSRLDWQLAPGVLGRLGDCSAGWCKLNVDGRTGYVHQNVLWGSTNP